MNCLAGFWATENMEQLCCMIQTRNENLEIHFIEKVQQCVDTIMYTILVIVRKDRCCVIRFRGHLYLVTVREDMDDGGIGYDQKFGPAKKKSLIQQPADYMGVFKLTIFSLVISSSRHTYLLYLERLLFLGSSTQWIQNLKFRQTSLHGNHFSRILPVCSEIFTSSGIWSAEDLPIPSDRRRAPSSSWSF